MDPRKHGPFAYSPINRRPKLRWPGDARVALWVIPNLEVFYLDEPLPSDTHDRKSPTVPMVREWSQRAYGNRVGVFRIMDVLSRHGIRATAALNSDLCEIHPQIIEDAQGLGWEFMGHGRTNSQYLTDASRESEARSIQECLATIERATGVRPKGWLGPGLQESWDSLGHLIDAGCSYVADWVADDQPFTMEVERGQIVSIPYSYNANDGPVIRHARQSPLEFERVVRDTFDVLYREGAESGRVMAVCVHPYVMGQSHRIAALDRALAYICSHDGVWKATGDEIVRHYLATRIAQR
jgi:peptidoglycan/xylan/chitin deacetylase (PgdA/CDA1 family)